MGKRKQIIAVRLSENDLKALARLSKKLELNRSEIIRLALDTYLKQRDVR